MTEPTVQERVTRLEDTIFANKRTGEPGVIARLQRIERSMYLVNAILAGISFLAGVLAQANHIIK